MRLLSLVPVLALAGCIAPSGDESFIILQNLAPTESSCTFVASPGAPSLSRGQLLLDSPIPYLFHPMFESRIVAPAGRESLRTIFVKGARVEVQIGPIERIDGAGNVIIDTDPFEPIRFTSLFAVPLPPNGGLATAQFDLVPLSALSAIRQRVGDTGDRVHAQIIATATPFGDYYGSELEGSPFTFPVTVCNDCIISRVFPSCPVLQTEAPALGNACNPFQDGVVDCCLSNGTLVCPAPIDTSL
jgi:hypothetical protein